MLHFCMLGKWQKLTTKSMAATQRSLDPSRDLVEPYPESFFACFHSIHEFAPAIPGPLHVRSDRLIS